MDSLNSAFSFADGTFAAAKAVAASSIFSTSSGGMPGGDRANFEHAREQLGYFKSWVFACVHARATRIAGQAVHVGIERAGNTASGRQRREFQHPLKDLLDDPNDLQIAWSLWYFTSSSLDLTGKCLWWKTKLAGREQILPIPTSWITAMNGTTGFTSFTIRPPTQTEEYTVPADECVYFFYPSPADPRAAASPLQAAASAVLVDDAIQTQQRLMFQQGLTPKVALVVGRNASPDGSVANSVRPQLSGSQRRQLVRSIRHVWNQTVSHGDPAIIDGMIESIQKLQMTPQECDFLESSKDAKSRICQIFGVNPIILGEIESANRASSLAAEEHLASSINPTLRLLGDTITAWLGPHYPVKGGKLVVWLDAYTPHDAEMELRRWTLAVQAGAVSADEIREQLLGLKPLPGGQGFMPAQPPQTLEESLSRTVEAMVMAQVGEYRRLGAFDDRAKSNGKVHGHV